MKSLNKTFSLWLPVVFWMGLIFYFSSISTLPSPQIFAFDFFVKKTAHMVIFGVLFFLCARALNDNSSPKSRWTFTLAFLFTLAYAVLDELHQSLTPGRHMKLTDVGFDMLGAFVVYLWLKRLLV